MSEADTPTPIHEQDLHQSSDVVNSGTPSTEPVALPDAVANSPTSPAEDWETVSFPNALNVDAIAQPQTDVAEDTPAAELATSTPTVLVSNQAVNSMGLIQELCQRNRDLLHRVKQLEEALEEYQGALQVQIGRSQAQDAELESKTQALTTAQEQTVRLGRELEFSQQTAQRQQILVETLAGQLETSQERVAQLERECALTQQRCNEQIHLLLQTENTCRDLRSRLNRQQRYTLQFKAALEKCLEVPAPCYEANADLTNAAKGTQNPRNGQPATPGHAFLPKAQPVQPWSAEPGFLEDDLEFELLPVDSTTDEHNDSVTASTRKAVELPPVITPVGPIATAATAPDSEATEATSQLSAPLTNAARIPISYNLRQSSAEHLAQLSADGVSFDQEAIAEALRTVDAILNEDALESSTNDPSDATRAELWELQSASLEDYPWDLAPGTTIDFGDFQDVQPQAVTAPEDEQLWQNLAALIDTPVADASGAGSFMDLIPEAIALDEVNAPDVQAADPIDTAEPDHPIEITIDQFLPPQIKLRSPDELADNRQSDDAFLEPDGNGAIPEALQSSWPSPVLYPLRHRKKRESLSAIELPTFPRRQA